MLLKNYLIIILYILIILKLSNTAIAEPIKSQLNCKIIDQNLHILYEGKPINRSGWPKGIEVGDLIKIEKFFYPSTNNFWIYLKNNSERKIENDYGLSRRYHFDLDKKNNYLRNSYKYQYVYIIEKDTTQQYGELRRNYADFGFVFDIGGLSLKRNKENIWFGISNITENLTNKPITTYSYSFICDDESDDNWDIIFDKLLITAININSTEECTQFKCIK